MFLPAYSPQLNAIELCWSKWKANIKRETKTDRPGLVALIDAAAETITQADCLGWNHETTRYYQKCIDKEPL